MPQAKPLLLGFGIQPVIQTQLSNSLNRRDMQTEWIATAAELAPLNEASSSRKREPGENIFGRAGALLDLISRRQPAIILMAANNPAIPWERWLPMLKRSPASRRIPILVMADHWPEAERAHALSLGATETVAAEEAGAAMVALCEQHAHRPNLAAVQTACAEPLDPRAREGIIAYNAGHYYEAHEFLEEAWKEDAGPGRDLYRAILQIGVALYQVQRGNYNGAVKMLLRVRQWLSPLPDHCRGVNVAALHTDALTYYEAIIALGPERLAQFEWANVRPVKLTNAP